MIFKVTIVDKGHVITGRVDVDNESQAIQEVESDIKDRVGVWIAEIKQNPES